MYTDRFGNQYECMEVTEKGDRVFHHGTKVISGELKAALDETISRIWDNLPIEKQDEINNNIMKKRAEKGA